MHPETLRKLLKIIIDGVALILIAIMLIIFAAWLSGCGKQALPKRFKEVERYEDMIVYVDLETGIAYAHKIETLGRDGGWFPLYDADGEHYRPNGWRDVG